MALIGRSSLDLYRILFLFVLVFSARFPAKGEPESPADEAKSPSVKECRVHIEAALEKYWEDQGPESEDQEHVEGRSEIEKQIKNDNPPADLPQANETDEETDETEEEDENADEQEPRKEDDEDDDEDDDDDEEEEDEDDDNDRADLGEKTKEEAEDDQDQDESDDDDDEEESDDDDDEEESDETERQQSDAVGSDEIDDDDEEEESDETERLESDAAGSDEVDDDDDEDDNDDDDDEEDGSEDKNDEETNKQEKEDDVDAEETNEDEDDEEDEEDEEEEDEMKSTEQKEDQEDEEEETSATESEDTEQTEAENVDDVDEDDDDEDDDDEEDDDEDDEQVIKPEPTREDEVRDDADDTVTKAEEKEEEEEEEEEEDEDDEDDEATGESDSAAAGVAPELSDAIATPEQSKATSDEEKEALEEIEAEEEEEDEEDEEELLESIYEEEEEEEEEDFLTMTKAPFRTRDHIDAILQLDEVGTDYDKEGDKLALSIFKEIKKIQETNVKPMEMIYKYGDSTTRLLGDAEIFSKPMVLFLGPWNSGKTTIINYLLGIERTPTALKTGTGITDVDFTVITHGDQRQIISGTELAADWTYASLQKFGQGFLDHFRGITVPHTLLKKITLVDTPGILENRKNTERGYSFNDAFQWFIDRADAIFVVLDPTKVDIGGELGSVVDQLKGRDVRFILNKADSIRRTDLMRVVGQLFWNLSPLMSSAEAPVIYAVSLMTKPFHPSAPARFLIDQEKNFLYDLREVMDKRVENKILYARRHAVRVRNHAKMVDCYLATFYRTKSIFSNKKNIAKLITENPADYNIYEGLGSMTNISRYDLPDPVTYKEFFKLHPLYDFKPLASTCSYFRGCPMDKLDSAISNDLPELFTKYKKAKSNITLVTQEGR